MSAYTHKDGVAWDRAPLPPERHRCQGQSWASLEDDMAFMLRCACGAAGVQRFAERVTWKCKNSRRHYAPTQPLPYRHGWLAALLRKVLS